MNGLRIRQNYVRERQARIMNIPLPPHRLATRPPEARGLARDAVKMLVTHYRDDQVSHQVFRTLPEELTAGDVLVLNTSGTLAAAVNALDQHGQSLRVHFSTHDPETALSNSDDTAWIVEVRTPDSTGSSKPFADVAAGDRLNLAEGVELDLIEPVSGGIKPRLWRARISGQAWQTDWHLYLQRQGKPIRYGYVSQDWPLAAYQTVFTTEAGSAEMPSAGRAFTPELITALVARGIQIAPLILHTGVSSQESGEAPYAEYYRISEFTAQMVNAAHAEGRRVIAVGTTAVRAIESSLEASGRVQAGAGWTRLMITPQRGMKVITGLLTGFHEPEATHLAMLEALTGVAHLKVAYAAALEKAYLWHEFGDLHLILP